MSAGQRRALLICNAKARNGGLDLDEVRSILRDALPHEPLHGFTADAGLPLHHDRRQRPA